MKKLLFVFSIVLNCAFANSIPSWYPVNDNIIKSYGTGLTLNEAKIDAFNKFLSKHQDLNQTILDDISITKQENIQNQYFVEIQYDKTPILEQLIAQKDNVLFPTYETNQYLLHTPLLQGLIQAYQYPPNIELDNQKLIFNNKTFIIKHNEYNQFLFQYKSDEINLNIKSQLKNKEKYFIQINPAVKGYLSLVQIYNTTDVQILFANKLINNQNIIFPDFKMSDGLEVDLDNNRSATILTIAFVCEEQKDFSKFNNLFLSTITVKNKLSDLINTIGNCEYSSNFTKVVK